MNPVRDHLVMNNDKSNITTDALAHPISNGMKILITGGLGFIFSHVTEYFVKKGWGVVVIDNESAGSHPEIIDNSFKYHKNDMTKPDVIGLIVKENPDYVVHAAAVSDVDYSIKEPAKTIAENIAMTVNAFEASRQLPNLKKVLYVSTDEIYGECDHKMKETDALAPKNPYSASKAAGSLIRLSYESTYKSLKGKTAEIRSCNAFGPRQDERKVLGAIKAALKSGASVPLYNEGAGFREFIYVKNIPPVIDLILNKGNGPYNVSLNDGLTISELIVAIEKVSGQKLKTHPYNRPGMDMKYEIDNSRIRALGWKPDYTFEEGLKEYLAT